VNQFTIRKGTFGCLFPFQRTENRNKPQVTDTHNRHVKDWFKWIKPTLPDATP